MMYIFVMVLISRQWAILSHPVMRVQALLMPLAKAICRICSATRPRPQRDMKNRWCPFIPDSYSTYWRVGLVLGGGRRDRLRRLTCFHYLGPAMSAEECGVHRVVSLV